MIVEGCAAFSSSKSSSSINVAFFEKTLKLTPPRHVVAPRGALVPGCATLALILFHVCSDRTDVPDIAAVFPDRAIRREAADTRTIEDRHARPVVLIGVRRAHPLLAIYIGLIIGQ